MMASISSLILNMFPQEKVKIPQPSPASEKEGACTSQAPLFLP
ncbi:hypothetical protein B4113_2136 [Geobacillus sp. B4113_201601]|nr:hypothetical protein B4113_2136 [Geobacillus sp. B4113_201601]